jgi:hypothetical protein
MNRPTLAGRVVAIGLIASSGILAGCGGPSSTVSRPPPGQLSAVALAPKDAGGPLGQERTDSALVEGEAWDCNIVACSSRPTSARLFIGHRLLASSDVYGANAPYAGRGRWYLFRFYVTNVSASRHQESFGPPRSSARLTVVMNNGWRARTVGIAPGATVTLLIAPAAYCGSPSDRGEAECSDRVVNSPTRPQRLQRANTSLRNSAARG